MRSLASRPPSAPQRAGSRTVTEALAQIGYSEPLAAKLHAEEAKLLDARAALAQATAAAAPAPLPRAYSGSAVLAVLENIGAAALASPLKAKALLHGIVEGILIQPTGDGYSVRVTLTMTDPALLSDGGVGDFQTGCWGLHDTFASPSKPASFTRGFGR
jgi:hypothetical protein